MTDPLTPVIVPAAAYVDYTYYTTTYGGTAIASTAFTKLALLATRQLDRLVYGRAQAVITANTDTNLVTAIKYATCAVAEELQNQGLANGEDGVQSESQGEYSVTYGKNSYNAKSSQTKLIRVARIWLDGTALLFPGFNSGEYGSGWD